MLQLSGFDLASWIQQLNQTEGMAYSPEETFDLYFFEQRLLEGAKATMAAIFHGIDKDFFTTPEKDILKAQQHSLKAAQRYFQGESATKPRLIVDTVLSQSIKNKSEYLRWLREQKKYLDDAASWEMDVLSSDIKKKLKKQWNDRTQFICHTHAALIEASKNLSSLVKYHQDAAKTFHTRKNRSRIPESFYKAYNDYLVNFFKTALQIEQKIAYEMQQRLANWDQHQSTQVFISLLQKKIKFQADPKENLPVFIDKLTPKNFSNFHRYIIKKGDEKTKIELGGRSWFHDTEAIFPTRLHNPKNLLHVVPASLAKYIPRSAPKLPWLFRDARFRYEFFNNKLGVLAVFKRSYQPVQCIVDDNNPQRWQKLWTDIREQEMVVQNEIIELSKKKRGRFLRIFQNRTHRLLQEWNAMLRSHQRLQIENKLALAKNLSQALKEKNRGNLIYTAVFSWQTCAALNRLTEEIRNNLADYTLQDTELESELKILQAQIAELLRYSRLFQALQDLANGKMLAENEWHYCVEQLDLLRQERPETYQAFLNHCLVQRSTINLQFKKSLKAFFTINNPEHVAHIHRLLLTIIQHGTDRDKADLEIRIKKPFLAYLNAILKKVKEGKEINLPNLQATNQLLQTMCEKIQRILGKEISHAGLPLSEHLRMFSNLSCRKAVLTCKARVLAASLAEEFLIARINNDSDQLDSVIKEYILTHPTLGYEASHVDNILIRLRDRAVKENKTVDILGEQLREDEKVIVGLNNPETAVVKTLLNASIFGKQASKVMRNSEIPFIQRIKYLEFINAKLKSLFSELDHPLPIKKFLTARSGRRLLFHADYVDVNLLELESSAKCEKQVPHQLNLTK